MWASATGTRSRVGGLLLRLTALTAGLTVVMAGLASGAEPQRSAGKFTGDYNRWFSGDVFDFEEVPVAGFAEVRPFILDDERVMVAWKAVRPKAAKTFENLRIAPREARTEANTLHLFTGESKARINTGWVDWHRTDLAERLIADPGSFQVTMQGTVPSRVPNEERTGAEPGETPYSLSDGALVRGKRIVKLRPGAPPEKLKSKSKLVQASEKFPEYAARIRWSKTGGVADRLLSLTDRQVEIARGTELTCWLAGGGIEGAMTAFGRLRGEVVSELNMGIDSLLTNVEGDYCKSLLTATIGFFAVENRKASNKAKCEAVAVRLQVAANGLAVVLPDAAAPALDVSCRSSKKATRLGARTRDGSPLASIAPRLALGLGSTDKPKRSPKAKVKAKQR